MSQTTTTHVSAIQHVSDSLRDPFNPKYCARYYLCFVNCILPDVITSDPDDYTLPEPVVPVISDQSDSRPLPKWNLQTLRSCQDQVALSALTQFLRVERTSEQIRSLSARMEKCSCDRRKDELVDQFHDWSWLEPAPATEMFTPREMTLKSLTISIANRLSRCIQDNYSIIHWDPDRRANSWPQHKGVVTGDAFDSESTLKMFCRWLEVYPSIQFIQMIRDTVFVAPVYAKLLESTTLPKIIVQLLNDTMDTVPADILRRSTDEKSCFREQINMLLSFMVNLLMDNVNDFLVESFYGEQAEPVLDALTRVSQFIDQLNVPPLNNMTLTLVNLKTAAAIHSKLVLPHDETRYHLSILVSSSMYRRAQIHSIEPYSTSQFILHVLSNMRSCSNRVCPRADQYEPSWAQCSGCHRVIYCSKSCQNADWADREKPHKSICKTLKAAGDVAGFLPSVLSAPPAILDVAEFEQGCTQAGDATQPAKLKRACQLLMTDDRILRSLNKNYIKHYHFQTIDSVGFFGS